MGNGYGYTSFSFYIKVLPQGCKSGLCFLIAFAALVQPYLVLTLYSQCFGASCNTSVAEHTTHAVLFQCFVLKVPVSETLL